MKIEIEEIMALYTDAIIEAPYKVYQLNSKGRRVYYRLDGEPMFYPSVTTIIHDTLPQSPHLVKWIAGMGYEEAERYKNERADYGTFMHACFEELLINRTFDLDGLEEKLKGYIENKKLPEDFIYHAEELKKDVLAFAQFVSDYDVKPIAVEIALTSREGYAGMIDLPCTMKKSIGKDERITAIVDFKSGRNGFYESCEIQLHLYKMMWEENFPDIKIDRVYNFSPKDWRKSPTYNLKDQTNSESAKKIPMLLELERIGEKQQNFLSVGGVINLNSYNPAENFEILSLTEIAKNHERKN